MVKKISVKLLDLCAKKDSELNKNRRLDYLYDCYACDKENTSVEKFHDLVNNYYYKYAADLYTFPWDLTQYYHEIFKNLAPGCDVIDIGAGTGFSYKLIRDIGYEYNKYWFVEPSKDMSDRLDVDDPKLQIENGYIESCWDKLSFSNNKKIFIMNATLHHIIDLESFGAALRSNMNENDIFFLPYEPNNGYHLTLLGRFYKCVGFIAQPISSIKTIIRQSFFFKYYKKYVAKPNSNIPDDHLSKSLQDLIDDNIVKDGFTREMIYATTDYGVYDNWKGIKMPNEFNEGFYTLDNISKLLGLEIVYLKTYSYLHDEDYGFFKKRNMLDGFLRNNFNKSGAFLCIALKKNSLVAKV